MQIAFPITLFQTPTSGFDPLTLNPAIWLDSSDASTISFVSGSTGPINRWADKSNNHADTTTPNSPVYSSTAFNSVYPGVDLTPVSGSPKWVNLNSALTTNDYEIMAALVFTPGNTNQRFLVANNFSNYQFMCINYNSPNHEQVQNFESVDFTGAVCPDTWDCESPCICDLSRAGSTMTPYFNGVQGTNYSWSAAQLQLNTIGVLNQAFSVGCAAVVAEIFIFQNQLTAADRGSLYNYMKSKWGLSSLPLDTTVGAVP